MERFVPITHVALYVLQPMFIAPVVIVRLYSLTSQHLKLIRSGSDKQELNRMVNSFCFHLLANHDSNRILLKININIHKVQYSPDYSTGPIGGRITEESDNAEICRKTGLRKFLNQSMHFSLSYIKLEHHYELGF